MSKMKSNYLKALGPGILFASTAIGVSHLVQSTQAGAVYGFGLLWAVILANVLKYPFFEFGSRYANVTGTSLIDGYKKLHPLALYAYFIITILSMFFVSAAVGKVTSGFMQNLFGISDSTSTTIMIFTICGVILFFGKYKILDGMIKIIGATLLVTTILAYVFTLSNGPEGDLPLFAKWFPEEGKTGFLLGLMGWMPTAVDLSSWNSLWTVERMKQTGYKPSLKETLFDFKFGYFTSAILSIVFVTMGAYLLYGTDIPLAKGAAGFANQVVGLYTTTIGEWSLILISVAAFSIMFGTCIAVFDGYSRGMGRAIELMSNNDKIQSLYRPILLITILGSFLLIQIYEDDPEGFKSLVNFATTLSFLIAPIVAVMNFILVQKKYLGDQAPGLVLNILGILGICYLTGFSLYFLATL